MITDEMRVHIAAAKSTLANAVRSGRPFTPVIVVVRDGVHLAHFMPPPANDPGQMVTEIARVAAEGFRADEIVIVVDSYAADDRPLNPLTHRPWQVGEMEELAAEHDGVAKGWVRDALSIMIIPRSGQVTQVVIRYTRDGTEITYDEPVVMTNVAGRMSTVMESANVFGGEQLDDMTMSLFLTAIGCSVLLGVPDTP